MIRLLLSVLVVSLVGLVIPSAFAENVPDWVKNTAGWWATDAISEAEFVNAIEYLVKEDVIRVNVSQTSETSQSVPDWVKNTAGWWATNAISETEFLNAIVYLIKVGIISVESSKSPELIAEMWVNDHITDDEFLTSIEHLIEAKRIIISDNSVTITSQLPDWLVNNAGWWAARILTNSDFDFDPGYTKEKIYPCVGNEHLIGTTAAVCIERTYNSHGFRGDEFEIEKPDNTFRISAVGGSTTFGVGAEDDETWPVYLQKIINEKITGKNIEVINFGVSSATAESEYSLIKNKISLLDPDLIIMYDGWNERYTPVEETIQNWESICQLGNDEGFDTIIVVQALSITGHRVSTEHEIKNSFIDLPYLQKSQQYVDAFEELDKVCTKTADFRRIFDYVHEPVFYDAGHTMSLGNLIIAENVFSVISPIYFDQIYSVIHNNLNFDYNELGVVFAVGSNLSGKNFDNLNLQNAVFDKADLSSTSFKNTNIDGARFVFANLDNSNLLDRTDLSNVNLAGTDLSNVDFTGKNLSGTILTIADLTGAILSGIDLSGKDLTGTVLKGVDLSGMDLTETILTEADLTGSILTGIDLSGKDLTGTVLKGVDLSGMDLTGTILTRADLTNSVLADMNLTGTILTQANFTNAIMSNDVLFENNFAYSVFNGVDFSGKDLLHSNFQYASFDNANLENIYSRDSTFIQVDFTKIKNKSLAGSDLTYTSFTHSNLSGVNLAGAILHRTNFWNANLSDLDFTVTDVITNGLSFIAANLSNSNFEGVDLSPKESYSQVFQNKAYLKNLSHTQVVRDLWGDIPQVFILSLEVRGNDLAVSFIRYNDFSHANLENANFKNADLRYAGFYSADLTNANLSGADLRNAFLEGANLEGANLSDMIYDQNTILKCINHPICNSD